MGPILVEDQPSEFIVIVAPLIWLHATPMERPDPAGLADAELPHIVVDQIGNEVDLVTLQVAAMLVHLNEEFESLTLEVTV